MALFRDLLTSWNVGPGGVIGIQWGVVPVFLDARGVKGRRRRLAAIEDLQLMEGAALAAWRRKAQQ